MSNEDHASLGRGRHGKGLADSRTSHGTIPLVGVFGVSAAFLFFMIGGSFARVTGQENTAVGISFEAGGGFAGFLLVFIFSVPVIGKLRNLEHQGQKARAELAEREHSHQAELAKLRELIDVKVYLTSKPKFPRHLTYKCRCSLYNEESGKKTSTEIETHWEAGYLTITVKNVAQDDYIDVYLEAEGRAWQCDFFHARARIVELSLREGTTP